MMGGWVDFAREEDRLSLEGGELIPGHRGLLAAGCTGLRYRRAVTMAAGFEISVSLVCEACGRAATDVIPPENCADNSRFWNCTCQLRTQEGTFPI